MLHKIYLILLACAALLLAQSASGGFYIKRASIAQVVTADGKVCQHRDVPAYRLLSRLLPIKAVPHPAHKKKSRLNRLAGTMQGIGLGVGYGGFMAAQVSGEAAVLLASVVVGSAFFLAGTVLCIMAMARHQKKPFLGIVAILLGIVFFIPLFVSLAV